MIYNLDLKSEAVLEYNNVYSICFRLARIFEREPGPNVPELYLNSPVNNIIYKCKIIKQRHYRFCDIPDCANNYDWRARTVESLFDIMHNCYDDFQREEIVTILDFKVS